MFFFPGEYGPCVCFFVADPLNSRKKNPTGFGQRPRQPGPCSQSMPLQLSGKMKVSGKNRGW